MNAVQMETKPLFTPQRTRVLNLCAKGYHNREIAELMNVCRATVDSHMKYIRKQTGIKSRTLLAFYALGKGLVTQDEIKLAMRREQWDSRKSIDA